MYYADLIFCSICTHSSILIHINHLTAEPIASWRQQEGHSAYSWAKTNNNDNTTQKEPSSPQRSQNGSHNITRNIAIGNICKIHCQQHHPQCSVFHRLCFVVGFILSTQGE